MSGTTPRRKGKPRSAKPTLAEYHDLLTNAPLGIFTATPEGRFCSVNPAMAGMYGYDTPQEMIDSVTSIEQQIYAEPSDRLEFRRLMETHGQVVNHECRTVRRDGSVLWVSVNARALRDKDGRIACHQGFATDITDRKRAEQMVQKRMDALTQPMEAGAIAFEDLFNIQEIQRIQDDFAMATGVASLITRPDGTPLTAPSNFTSLCNELIRKTEKGRRICAETDAAVGRCHPHGPLVHVCLNAGLWHAGASIMVGGRHIANWLIGQVRDETPAEEALRTYARELGVDESSFIKAFHEVPVMPKEKFAQIARALFALASQLSATAYQNILQARVIAERKQLEETLFLTRFAMDQAPDSILWVDDQGSLVYANDAACTSMGFARDELLRMKVFDIDPDFPPDGWERHQEDLKRLGRMTFEGRHRTKDGRFFPVEVTTTYFEYKGRFVNIAFDRGIGERKKRDEALRESELRFRSLVETTSDWVWEIDRDGFYTYASPKVRDLLGYEPEEVLGKRPFDLLTPEEVVRLGPEFIKTMDEHQPFSAIENINVHKDGRRVVLETSAVPVFDAEGLFTGYRGIDRDVTDRKRKEEALRASEILYQSIFENTGTAMLIIEEDMTISLTNSEFERMTGYSRAEIDGRKWPEFVETSDRERMIRLHRLRRGADAQLAEKRYEFRLVHKEGHLLDIDLVADIIPGTNKTVASCVDITARKRMEEALRESEGKFRELSILDGLTQLFNSRHFYDRLKIEIDRVNRYAGPLALILLDLDNFKAFNDACGHVEGDRVLTRLGAVIKGCLRSTDSAYRYGGEEFTVLLPMTRSEDAAVTAERIRTEFKKEALLFAPGREIRMTLSMGLGQYHPQEEMKAFVHRIDQLMYQAKRDGKDRICCER